jgi:hypothetical protein
VGATLIVTVVLEALVAARVLPELAAVGGLESVHVICEILQELVRAAGLELLAPGGAIKTGEGTGSHLDEPADDRAEVRMGAIVLGSRV